MLQNQIQKDLLNGIDLNQFSYLKTVLKGKEKIFRREIVDYFIKKYRAKVEIHEFYMYVDPILGTDLSKDD